MSRVVDFSFFWYAILSLSTVLCVLFASKFDKNTNLKINLYKNRQYLRIMFGWA